MSLTPYFFDGRVHLPQPLLQALLQTGLDRETAFAAETGLDLDDSSSLSRIRTAAEQYLSAHATNDPIVAAIESREFRFMLSDNGYVGA
jgi:hypothetical protein